MKSVRCNALLQLRPAILEMMTALFICIKNILLESLVTSRDPVNVEIMGYNNKEATKIKRKKASNETQESYIRMSLCEAVLSTLARQLVYCHKSQWTLCIWKVYVANATTRLSRCLQTLQMVWLLFWFDVDIPDAAMSVQGWETTKVEL